MAVKCGAMGNFLGGNCSILFFIILFLLLFDGGGCGKYDKC